MAPAAAASGSSDRDHDGRTPRSAVVALPRAPATTPAAVFALTYLTWASIHAARKSYSVVKPTLLEEEWLTTPLLDHVAKGALSTAERLSVPDTCFFVAFALSTLWKGAISDSGDPRVIMASALAGCSLLLALFGLGYFARVHPVLYFGLLWALQAFGQALVWPAAVRVMGDWFKGEGTRSVVMGLWCSSNNIGNIVGTGVGALSSVALGSHAWGAPMLALALLLLAVSWVVFCRLTPTPRLVGRAPYRGSAGAKEELVEAFGATGLLDDEEGGEGEGEEEQEEGDEEETVIAFGPASPMVRPDDGGWEERRRPLLEPVGGDGSMDEGVVLQPEVPAPALSMSMWRALWLPGVVEVSISYAALKVRGRKRNRKPYMCVCVCVSQADPQSPLRPPIHQPTGYFLRPLLLAPNIPELELRPEHPRRQPHVHALRRRAINGQPRGRPPLLQDAPTAPRQLPPDPRRRHAHRPPLRRRRQGRGPGRGRRAALLGRGLLGGTPEPFGHGHLPGDWELRPQRRRRGRQGRERGGRHWEPRRGGGADAGGPPGDVPPQQCG